MKSTYTLAMSIIASAISGCVTMESQPLPEAFKGQANIIDVPNTKIIKPGPVEVDEYFAEYQIRIGREARLENNINLKSSMIKKGLSVAKAGDIFIALPFRGKGGSNTSQFSWCRAGQAGVNAFENFFTGDATPICLFWLNAVPRFAKGGTGSRIFPEGGVYDPNVWTNPPELTELGESDIGPLYLEVKIDSVNSKGKMKVETMFRDPEGDRSVLLTDYYTPDTDGTYTIKVFDGRMRIKPIPENGDGDILYKLEPITN